jgi:hypothetical protein
MNNCAEFYWPAASGFERERRSVCCDRGAANRRYWCEGPYTVRTEFGPRCAVPA